MRPIWFVGLHLPGTVLRIIVVSRFAQSGDRQLGWVVGPIDRNAGWLTPLFAVGTILTIVVTAVVYRNRSARERDSGVDTADEEG
jgi:hypothetical protein